MNVKNIVVTAAEIVAIYGLGKLSGVVKATKDINEQLEKEHGLGVISACIPVFHRGKIEFKIVKVEKEAE